MAEMNKKTPFSIDPELAKSPSFQRTQSEPPPPMHSASHGGKASLGSDIARTARKLVDAEVGREAGKGADQVGGIANALRQTSLSLEHNMVVPYVDRAADELERVANFLRNVEAKEIVKSVETMAQKRPLIFLGGAFALGFLGARFLRSGATEATKPSSRGTL